MRVPIVVGNWKMNGLCASVRRLAAEINEGSRLLNGLEIVLLPAFVHLSEVHHILYSGVVALGGQNFYAGSSNAVTGEISAPMLVDMGCSYVLLGHSERRILFNESHVCIADKLQVALAHNLKPIFCVGETLAERQSGATEAILAEQLQAVIARVGIDALASVIIAYEPVWAIGSGLTAKPEAVQKVHHYIRSVIARFAVAIAKKIRILYGGSVKAENARAIFAMPDVDGGLIGGAALNAAEFLAICQHAIATSDSVKN
jgi:triosephosphate isomerase